MNEDNNTQLKVEIKDLFNQVMIKLKDIKYPELDSEYDSYDHCDAGAQLAVEFKRPYSQDITLSCVKIIIEQLVKEIDGKTEWNTKKMARAYYSSFCNG